MNGEHSKAPQSSEKQRKRMKKVITDFHRYVSTYMDGDEGRDLSAKSVVLDMVYGIGISLDRDQYYGADGFDRFKAQLRGWLG